jgi:2-oxoglutarate ferredoxin oxidoreductase subunit beta
MRRNVDIRLVMFNNRIYGLTKGQASPTSEIGKKTKSSPDGTIDFPVSPLSVALAAEATFVARSIDTFTEHLQGTLNRAGYHRGSAFIEVLQNCNIFNDGAFDLLKDPETKGEWIIGLEHGKEVRFGSPDSPASKAVVRNPLTGSLSVEDQVAPGDPRVVVHDAHAEDPSYAFALSRLSQADSRYSPMGVFRDVTRPSYDQLLQDQLGVAKAQAPGDTEALTSLLRGSDTWTIG